MQRKKDKKKHREIKQVQSAVTIIYLKLLVGTVFKNIFKLLIMISSVEWPQSCSTLKLIINILVARVRNCFIDSCVYAVDFSFSCSFSNRNSTALVGLQYQNQSASPSTKRQQTFESLFL